MPIGANSIPCWTTARLYSPPRFAYIGVFAMVLATFPGNRGPNSTAGKFAYGSNATAERRNKYQRQHFSSTSKIAVHNKSATQGKVVSRLCIVRFNDPCFFVSVSNLKSSGSLPPPAPHAARMALYLSSV